MKNVFVLIMAGGEGTRFYPLSTPEQPKQFLNFIGQKTFIRQTFERVAPLVPLENIYVSTNEKYVSLVEEQIPELSADRIIAEPFKRNTAPALAYCTALIDQRDNNATVICLPSDHHIQDEDGFRKVLAQAVSLARDDYLVTFGMEPTWASPEYGYICPLEKNQGWSPVKKFAEKPDTQAAEKYRLEGYLWNGGIFLWKASVFLSELKLHAPDCAVRLDAFRAGYDFMREYFRAAPSISIDRAVMEKSGKVVVIPVSVGWSDVGTWESVHRLMSQGIDISGCVKAVLQGDDLCPWRCVVPKPWGHEELWALTQKYVGKILFIRKGHRLSLQYHKQKDETLRLLSGNMEIEVGDERARAMNSGDVQHVPPGMKHRIRALSDCLVLEVSTPEIDDVVRIADDYGRQHD
ncbi:MAG: mannose-1-phosphate guanylyltransferase [Pseudomonadota bacterium]